MSFHEPLEKTVFAANPLVTSVLPENVRVGKNRAIVGLWPHWPFLLERLCDFGCVLSIGRNGYAVLGRIGHYPRIRNASCGHYACAQDGSMEFDFAAWNRAAVLIDQQPGGWLYSVEFYDACGGTIHKICLTADSDFEAFRDWVDAHQAPLHVPAREDFPRHHQDDSTPGVPRKAVLLHADAIQTLLYQLISEKRVAQFIVGCEGFVQGADLLPTTIQEQGQWLFLSDEDSGLHLRHGRLAEIYLLQAGPAGSPGQWVLKAADPEGRMVCALTAPRREMSSDWNEFLLDTTTPFRVHKTQS